VGFHSNDARGATIRVDPASGLPARRVTPLVRARGAEIGLRSVSFKGVQTTLAIWTLGLDSELVFVGDAGTTEAGRPSRRYGVEWTNYARLAPWLSADVDVSWSNGRFTDGDAAGDRIPGAVERVVSAGMTIEPIQRIFGGVRARHLGPRPLVEDDSVRSEPTTIVNLEAGYVLSDRMRLVVDVFNLLDAEDSDIDYFYASRLPGEPAGGVEDVHLHPTLPRTVRFGLRFDF
jgi:outer membrane receptor protein involved in Fe transport